MNDADRAREEIAVKRAERDVVNEEIERLKSRAKTLSIEITNLEQSLPATALVGDVTRVEVNR